MQARQTVAWAEPEGVYPAGHPSTHDEPAVALLPQPDTTIVGPPGRSAGQMIGVHVRLPPV